MQKTTTHAEQFLAASSEDPRAVAARKVLLPGLILCMLAQSMQAAPAHVTIDLGTAVECHDVTTPDFAQAHPGDKIVEATFHLSVLLKSGREEDLEALHLVIAGREGRMRVVDFRPRTELASELAGDVEVSATADKNCSVNASLGGLVSSNFGPVHAQSSPGAAVAVVRNHGTKETYHRLANKQVVLASGTVEDEHGVFFKWRRSSQLSLEGAREVSCRFLVPRAWRGDWVIATCEVLATQHNYLGKKIEPCEEVRVVVGLYLAGDTVAQKTAYQLSERQGALKGQSGNPADSVPGVRHTVYKPTSCAGYSALEWLTLAPLFKSHNHASDETGGATAAVDAAIQSRPSLSTALDSMRQLSGR